ncbi:hypothetical protein OJAV_G00046220 [Oryzias javanicus]|uniref:HECT domain-containing protein n=1 Tax=Oryzias javanicus TaxID=123683 RepID=A0A3S2N444_ORYJA|nr:hypothetical protein OJAV_G00046220 [Oryzias javanicus]
MACGSRLVTPKLEAGQDLDAILIHKIYKSKALYVRPSKPIVEDETGCSSEDDKDTESTFSPRDLRSSSQGQPSNPTWDSFSSLAAASTQSAPAPSDVPSQHSVSLPASCLSNAQLSTSSSEGTSGLSANYNSYLTVVAALSDASSDDEELNKAILASLQTESCPPTCSVPVKDLLQDLAKQINHLKNSKFNINRNTVLDGAIRGFKRGTYDPCNTMSVRFSDDMGVHEEAVDLGGPRREFLRLLIEALPQSQMFEGQDGRMNLALDSAALREDRYFIAGRAIAVSLVHGGPPAGFLSPTLFASLVHGPECSKPTLEDVADRDLQAKIKKIAECQTIEDLLKASEQLEDYLANAGCLRHLQRLEDKDLLVADILMFQVVHRVRGPFERYVFSCWSS